jgi:glycosyltransferase involved in cell wall biosynthesis
MSKFGISIVLPVLNEAKNLEYFIPKFAQVIESRIGNDFEIIVVDDNSTDNTASVVKNLQKLGFRIIYILRNNEKSLPLSIFEGVRASNFETVMWLDADGSMDEKAVENLVENYLTHPEDVFIGSRFVLGGGYKGFDKDKKNDVTKVINRLLNSEESILAVTLSKYFNSLLSKILKVNIKDLTSGFIVGKRKHFNKEMFEGFTYGEYFINVVVQLHIKKIKITEIGYYCNMRKYGSSKSSENLFKMILLSTPYIQTAYKSRKIINEYN